ncbi:uncharacterized protein FOBCDRAFT_260326 [Fusarium oxysporum Fo47]|uniref:uncharacterized protein n=1 Tax=Fusarium oxysporum Fo47 TaxID=660027 RepID=UPI002869C611|nr:uncharacterized protein FOBCDRAFT_260326 [Fusarium oxysporum Fo47]QKD53759.2 hypothetical protein FOBCDRAFT_260326 [Fusarium oxysporum Fo47]
MTNSSLNPPSTLFKGLSLADHPSSAENGSQSTPGRSSPRTFDLSFSSPSSGPGPSSSSDGVFVFGQQSPNQNVSSRNVLQFGGDDQDCSSLQKQPFSFQSLHNMTPLPSRSPSPLPCRATPQQQSSQLFSSFMTPPARTTRAQSTSNSQVPPFSFNSLSSPASDRRQRSLSFVSSAVSTPSRTQLETPDSSYMASQNPEPPALVIPYDTRTELAFSHALFTSVFQDALKEGPNIAQKAVKAIEKMQAGNPGILDSDVSKFLDDAKDLQQFQGSDTRTIAVLGDSGEGKSSLINSLLHFPGVAQTGDIGSACTSVVTEYRQKKAGHTAPITIDVEYLSAPEIRDMIQELLWSYRQLYLPGVESDETSEQDYNRYMRESEQAWSALHAAFKHKRQFTKKFAQDMSNGALERITGQLIEWAQEIEWPAGGVDGFWTSTAQTADECVEHTKLFMQDKFWPFTKIIRVYLNSQVLKTGVVLADLPGLHDTNLARVRATQDYLMKCDNIIIVAKISRAITDQSLKYSLFYVLSRHMPTEWEDSGAKRLNVAVVCTKSEEINLVTARRELCGPNKAISIATMESLDSEIDTAKSSGDRKRKKDAKKQQELLLVQARNEHVKRNLQTGYSSEMDGRNLDVFCVSNKWYEKYCPKGNNTFVDASGIPDLRRFCHTLTADAQLNEAKHYLRSRLSALLNSLDLWANSSLDEQDKIEELDDSVRAKAKEALDQIPNLVATFRQDFTECFQEQIMTFFGQYNAWCLNYGDHQTPKRGRENWNAKIIWKMRMELEGQWDIVEEEVTDVFSAVLHGAMSLLDSLKSGLSHSLPPQHVNPIAQSINAQIENLKYKMSREERRLHAEVRVIRRYASESNYNSYVLQDMIPQYRSAASQKDIALQSYEKSEVSPATHGRERQTKIRDFAKEIESLKQQHKYLLQSLEAI